MRSFPCRRFKNIVHELAVKHFAFQSQELESVHDPCICSSHDAATRWICQRKHWQRCTAALQCLFGTTTPTTPCKFHASVRHCPNIVWHRSLPTWEYFKATDMRIQRRFSEAVSPNHGVFGLFFEGADVAWPNIAHLGSAAHHRAITRTRVVACASIPTTLPIR